jgi:hypothetical protein
MIALPDVDGTLAAQDNGYRNLYALLRETWYPDREWDVTRKVNVFLRHSLGILV